jgi:hypothetical protein
VDFTDFEVQLFATRDALLRFMMSAHTFEGKHLHLHPPDHYPVVFLIPVKAFRPADRYVHLEKTEVYPCEARSRNGKWMNFKIVKIYGSYHGYSDNAFSGIIVIYIVYLFTGNI